MKRFSAFQLIREGLNGQRGWPQQWRKPEPKKRYDVIVVGGGGHGLATAYYLAKQHGIKKIAVLEKGWIGGGNAGRNTAIIRANYFYSSSAAFYSRSLELYRDLSKELNYNIMFSPRGLLQLAHSRHELELMRRWYNAMRLNGVKALWLERAEIEALCPLLDCSGEPRFPILGGFLHPDGGIARHDAVVWAYARAADALGVDIVENCSVDGLTMGSDGVVGVTTSHGPITAGHVSLAVTGNTAPLARSAGIDLPIECFPLQAFVTEPVKPVLDLVVISGTVHAYVSQSDKGELVVGAAMDGYPSRAQQGDPDVLEDSVAALLALFPAFGQLRMLRQWAGTVDVTPDRTPIMGLAPVAGLSISAGWGTGGFKAIPAGGETMAATIAAGLSHSLIAPFALDRFASGRMIDESIAASVAH